MDIPRLTPKERLILDLLLNAPGCELYGLEMVKKSGGALKRGTVYVTLERMADKGYVTSREMKASRSTAKNSAPACALQTLTATVGRTFIS